MADSLRVCREYGQPPSWWDGLPRGDRALLIADLHERADNERKAHERAHRASVGRRR